jgi:hypothetical protein
MVSSLKELRTNTNKKVDEDIKINTRWDLLIVDSK